MKIDKISNLEGCYVFNNPSYDTAIIGVTNDNKVIYDYDKMIDCLKVQEGWEYEDCVEQIEYNTLRTLPYIPNPPIIMYAIGD